MPSDPRKQSVNLRADVLRELRSEAKRQDRKLSWLIQRAWKIARVEIKAMRAPEAEAK
jgi:uncharacterized small protein (TIGR04563 family)